MKNMEIVDALKEISSKTGKSLTAAAIRWILDYLSDSAVIVGIKNKEQLLSNCEGLSWSLSKEDLNTLTNISNC